jgi:hypothetical protein
MRKLLILTALLQFVISPAPAQTPSQTAASKADRLSLEQKTKISELITRQSPPLAASSFSIAVDGVVPADIQVHSLPPRGGKTRLICAASATWWSRSSLPSSSRARARWR